MEPLPAPVQLGTITEEELAAYDGTDPQKPLLMAIRKNVYDVSQSRGFYGPGGAHSLFAGKDASRALAKMSFEKEDLTGDTSGLGAYELYALDDWEHQFQSEYHKVGELPKHDLSTVGAKPIHLQKQGSQADRPGSSMEEHLSPASRRS